MYFSSNLIAIEVRFSLTDFGSWPAFSRSFVVFESKVSGIVIVISFVPSVIVIASSWIVLRAF